MKKIWTNLKNKLAVLLEREPNRVRLIAWRNRVTTVLVFLDKHFYRIIGISISIVFIFLFMQFFFWRAPSDFPEQALITIERGESLSSISQKLQDQNVIRSVFWLKVFETILGGQKKVIAGDYYFPNAVSVFSVARTIHNGRFGLISLKTTIPEGSTSTEIADILEKRLPSFDREDFLKEVQDNNYEGYLFPDTYFFMPNTKSSDIILMMRENFARQIKDYEQDIADSQKSLNDIVIMASIIESESNGSLVDKRIVSGILWNRLRKKMPLQVDSSFQYYNGKNSYTLTKDDLTEDHPYNTYTNKGLPPTAISNPGLDSLRAAIAPTNTDYLYFLSDENGNMHYAKTFDEHKVNKELYLN